MRRDESLLSNPESQNFPSEGRNQIGGGKVISGQFVLSGSNTGELFEPKDRVFDAVGPFAGVVVEREWLGAVGPVRDAGHCAAFIEPLALHGPAIDFVTEQFPGWAYLTIEPLRRGTIAQAPALKRSNEDGPNICDCVDFRTALATPLSISSFRQCSAREPRSASYCVAR
jgi:hypothetical protein